jgi:thioredoxin 1
MPKSAPNAITVLGSIVSAFELSESKYRTRPALDISPPEFLPLLMSGPRAEPGLNLSARGREKPLCAARGYPGHAMSEVTLIDFHADWCGPCKTQDPIIEEIEADYDDAVNFEFVDVDEDPDRANEYSVRSIPTVIVTAGDEVVERFVGVTQREPIEEALQAAGA